MLVARPLLKQHFWNNCEQSCPRQQPRFLVQGVFRRVESEVSEAPLQQR